MREPEVVLKTKHYLEDHLIKQKKVVQLYTDAHGTLLAERRLRPFQRFTLDFGHFALHPDLVGLFDDGATIFAVEAKGSGSHREILTGLAQAQMYQAAFHEAYLAVPDDSIGEQLISFARTQNLGMLIVGDAVHLACEPLTRTPQHDAYTFVRRQMDTVLQVATGATYHFNIPTHYLVWAILLHPRTPYLVSELPTLFASYPMPQEWRSALRGSKKLGLVRIGGPEVWLTEVGAAVKEILPGTLDEWTQVHQVVGRKGGAVPLVEHLPHVAAVLRILLLGDPMVRLIVAGLEGFADHQASFAALARMCDALDHTRTLIFFFNPETVEVFTDARGRIDWSRVQQEHYRSKMFHQYKSILKHAGILTPRRLGGTSSKNATPEEDIWELR